VQRKCLWRYRVAWRNICLAVRLLSNVTISREDRQKNVTQKTAPLHPFHHFPPYFEKVIEPSLQPAKAYKTRASWFEQCAGFRSAHKFFLT
jgi:hypothetical protein